MLGFLNSESRVLQDILRTGSQSPATGNPGQAPATDNGYHFPTFRTGSSDQWYTEWWYYNFYDPKSQIAAIAVFQVVNPSSRWYSGKARLLLSAFPGPGQEPVLEEQFYEIPQFSASTLQADVQLGPHKIETVSPDVIRISAELFQIKLSLEFQAKVPPVQLADNSKGPSDWEVSNWLAYMPAAAVSGTITLGGDTTAVEHAVGYHDHNWGKWLWPAREFYWVSFVDNQQGLSFDLGHGVGFQPGYLGVLDRQGQRIIFPASKRSDVSVRDYVRQGFFRYPAQVEVSMSSDDDRYLLALSWKPHSSVMVSKIPLAIFEQRSVISGRLVDQQTGEVFQFEQEGFSEWTELLVGAHLPS